MGRPSRVTAPVIGVEFDTGGLQGAGLGGRFATRERAQAQHEFRKVA
jgi:hypothetical protein